MTKIFAHRGFVTSTAQENSIESLREAHKNHFIGVEFDLWLIDDFVVVNHDLPEKKHLSKLPNFRDYLIFKNDLEYWIDFKNLDKSNVEQIMDVVVEEINRAKIDYKKVYFAPFITELERAILVYDVVRNRVKDAQIMAVCESLSEQNFIFYHQELQKNNIKFLSIQHEIINEKFMQIFSDINLFAWTVNDLARLRDLQKLGVKNFTSDIILPKML